MLPSGFEPESSAYSEPPFLGRKGKGFSRGRDDWPDYTTGAYASNT